MDLAAFDCAPNQVVFENSKRHHCWGMGMEGAIVTSIEAFGLSILRISLSDRFGSSEDRDDPLFQRVKAIQ